jgi:hypothetical protein
MLYFSLMTSSQFIYSNRDPKAGKLSLERIMVDHSHHFAVILMGFSYVNLTGVFSTLPFITPFYNGTEAKFNKTFVEFLAIPATTISIGPLSYNDITKVLPPDPATSEGVRSIHLTSFSHIYSLSLATCA